MAPLCKFWQQGNCRNGANCRFEHPGANRFGPLSSGGGGGPNRPQDGSNPYKITKDSIKVDLAEERPMWILSCYGPGRDAPEQLFGGYPREQSLEEVMMYIRGSANQQQAMTDVTGLYQQAEQQIHTTLNNLDGAMQFLLAAENNHPNRIDICKQNTGDGGTTGIFSRDNASGFPANPLSSSSSANQSPFSAAVQANPFGGGTPSFGQPSALGQKSNPFASTQPSTFGRPAALGQKPNPFGTTSSVPSPFAQAATSTPSTFGQPSSLGQRSNPFGAPAASATASPNPFAQSGAPKPSPFSQPATVNPFAQASGATKPSADLSMDTSAPAPAQPPGNVFGKPSNAPSPFAASPGGVFAAQKPTGFGTAAGPGPINPFAQPQAQPQPQLQPPALGTAATKGGTGSPYPSTSTKHHPVPSTYISKTMHGQVSAFKGQPVMYKWKVGDKYQDERPPDAKEPPVPGVRNPDGSWRKIFFPDGPPAYNPDTEPESSVYDEGIRKVYEAMTARGTFDGDMPDVPPMREECVWDF
ncbi:hypothetical protein F4779DRAFT_459069 [Xylariaceae sp. FL0662B]|nr:hypothetical protein F4779DRAFT_459069 [Xylariaceae sp. FL0662B]